MVVCRERVKQFHVECLGVSEEGSEWTCVKCSMKCHSRTDTSGNGGLGLLDMNASPPRETDGDDVDVGLSVNSESALAASSPNMQDMCGNPFVGYTLTSPNTHKDSRYVAKSTLDSKPMVSNRRTESRKRLGPPGNTIASNLPPGLIGDVIQAHEFCLRFHKILGQDAPLSRQKMECELLDPWVDDGLKPLNNGSIKLCEHEKIEDFTSSSRTFPNTKAATKCTGMVLPSFQMALVKVIVEDMLAKVVICEPCGATQSKTGKGRKKNVDVIVSDKKIKLGIFPVNEITWPEVARRCILVLLFLDGNLEASGITNREFDEVFRCLNGGGSLCGSLTGMSAIEADAVVLAEASKKIFSSVKSNIADFIIDQENLGTSNSATETKRTDNKCPEWISVLEPVRRQPTNVGSRIRDRVRESLKKDPPEWAKEKLLRSISKEVYKGNASGPTKKIVVSVLDQVRDENPLTKKKAKESRVVRTASDVIIKRCRMVLRSVSDEDEKQDFFGLMAESLLKPNEDDVGHLATVSRLLDFRIIDLRLDAGFYGDSHESFIEDVREVWQNLRVTFRNKPKYIDLIETFSKKLEELYEQEVVTLVNKIGNDISLSSDETKKELNDTITSTLFIAAWEDGICKVCGKDENDNILLLCDRCDDEYHTYCLDPPLQRVPKASWYCPPCISFITRQVMLRHKGSVFHKKVRKEFTRNGLEALADLADNMESMEYWELGIKERVFLLKFLCDEALSSNVIRDYITEDGFDLQTNFLGRDLAGRLYHVLGHPTRAIVACPFDHGSWFSYESDAEIKALVKWLEDDDPREKELKENIIEWQRNKSNDHHGQVKFDGEGISVKTYSSPSIGRVSEIFQCLKVTLLDIEAALASEAFRRSRGGLNRRQAWREFVKSVESVHEMVQATIVLEDMIKTEHLRKEWWFWSSPSTATKISNVSSLALRIYALDAAIFYEKPPVDPTEPIATDWTRPDGA